MKIDSQVIHSNDLGYAVGEFHGTPIKSWDPEKTRIREFSDAGRITQQSMLQREKRKAECHNV
jgi:hypothetical protein